MVSSNEYRILSQLSYIDFNMNGHGDSINESKYLNKTLAKLGINDVFYDQNAKGYSQWQPEIDKIKNDWKIIEYENNNYSNGFVGVAFQNLNTDEIVDFRGTRAFVSKIV